MAESTATILIVDDELAQARQLQNQLHRRDPQLQTFHAADAEMAMALLQQHNPEVAVVDLSLDAKVGPASGLELISNLIACDDSIRILVLTGHGSEQYGIQALQRGAASFLQKPIDPEHLYPLLLDGIHCADLKRNHRKLTQTIQSNSISGFLTVSPRMETTVSMLRYASSNNLPVLITGETGVGKGLAARAIHRMSERHNRSFVRVQPSFVNHDMLASELFGHTRGSFTGAQVDRVGLLAEANRGTLFIDEIGELPSHTQVVLLETLQERTFRAIGSNREITSDFRLISATNVSFDELQRGDRLRRDFFHRIAQTHIEIPPLRERPEDIPLLVLHFLEIIEERESLGIQGFADDAIAKLTAYRWPGNVRELYAVVEASCYRASYAGHLRIQSADIHFLNGNGHKSEGSFRDRVREYEERLVKEAMLQSGDNQSHAASLLQLDRTSLRRMLSRMK